MSFKDFGQTIAAIRKEKHLSQPQLAELFLRYGIDIKAAAISKWEKNVTSPNVLQFFILCDILGITDINDAFDIAVEDNLYAQLNDEGRKLTQDYMSILLQTGKYTRKRPAKITPIRTLPFFSQQPVAAGTGNFLDSDQPYEEIEVGDNVSDKADFGVRVSGDSMEPLYVNGQIIWIHKQDFLEEGDIGIFSLDGNAYVKKYHIAEDGIELISLNKKYAPIKVSRSSTLKTFGKVVS